MEYIYYRRLTRPAVEETPYVQHWGGSMSLLVKSMGVDGLCVPQDSLDDIDWFPNFKDDFIPLDQLLPATPTRLEETYDAFSQQKEVQADTDHVLPHPEEEEGRDDDRDVLEELFGSLEDVEIAEGEKRIDVSERKEESGVSKEKENHWMEKENRVVLDKRKGGSTAEAALGEKTINVGFLNHAKGLRSKRCTRTSSISSTLGMGMGIKMGMGLGALEKGPKKKRCEHCETEKTPQWRMGPTGPKTLCNACGMRFKSGKLLPEYRPASSPTFDTQKHSNFHKQILKRKRLGRVGFC